MQNIRTFLVIILVSFLAFWAKFPYRTGYYVGYYSTVLAFWTGYLLTFAFMVALAIKALDKLGLSRLLGKLRPRPVVVIEETRLLNGSTATASRCLSVNPKRFLPKGKGKRRPTTVDATVVATGKSISDEKGIPVAFQGGLYQGKSKVGPRRKALPSGEGKAASVASPIIARGRVSKPSFKGGLYRMKY